MNVASGLRPCFVNTSLSGSLGKGYLGKTLYRRTLGSGSHGIYLVPDIRVANFVIRKSHVANDGMGPGMSEPQTAP